MSTQNIISRKDLLVRFDSLLRKQGNKYLLMKKYRLGDFNNRDMVVLTRLSEIICTNACTRLPLRGEAEELLSKQLNKF